MKTPPPFVRVATLLAALFLATAGGAEEAGAPSDRILQQELKQQQLQRATLRLGEQLAGIIEEFERNGLAGEDLRTLRAVRTVLGRLSEKEMRRVVVFLEQARTNPDAGASSQGLTGAYASQKTIITLLKQLVLEYERQQALYELSIRFREMAARQGRNMRVGVWLARQTERNRFNEEQKLALQVQRIDQLQINEETSALVARLNKLAVEIGGTAASERPKAAAKQVQDGGLTNWLFAAAEELKNGQLIKSATSNEKKARDEMREIARLLLLSKDLADLLRAAIRETEATILFQKDVMEETRKIEQAEDSLAVEQHQAEAVDVTDLIHRDIKDAAPVAAGYLRAAFDSMQEAREVLLNDDPSDAKRRAAPARQRDAVTGLEQAKRALQDQLAKAEAEIDRPENALVHLRDLQEEVKQLIEKQEKLKQEAAQTAKPNQLRAKAPEQGTLKDQAQDAQQKAAPEAPAAAQALDEAAQQMEAAQKAFAQSRNSPEAQQAAVDSLKKADAELGKEIARLEDAEKQLSALEKLSDKVSDLIKGQEQVNADTAKEAAKPSPSLAQSKSLANQEAALARAAAEALVQAERPSPSAAPHLAEARAQMNDAKGQLGKPDAKSAEAPERKALAELFAAKKEIDTKIGDLKQDLGLPPDSAGPSLADAMAAIEKAQGEVNQAMAQMTGAPPGLAESAQKPPAAPASAMDAAARELGQAAQDITPVAAGDMGPLPAAAEAALQSALGALNQGAAQAAAHQQSPAQANASVAAQALAQAQAALALAEAGLKSELAQMDQGEPGGQQGQPAGKGRTPGPAKPPGQNQQAANQPGRKPGQQPGPGTPPPRGTGDVGNWRGAGGANGPQRATAGFGSFVGLPGRDRAAIQQSQGEKYPQEYGPMVEQYLRNLSDQSQAK
ncbi:MAG: hypothetical protein HZA90_20790 [Verrucomicrobia bacterium]|nr:hypothetical protein [Verrucomicrobiota bacterium]